MFKTKVISTKPLLASSSFLHLLRLKFDKLSKSGAWDIDTFLVIAYMDSLYIFPLLAYKHVHFAVEVPGVVISNITTLSSIPLHFFCHFLTFDCGVPIKTITFYKI